MAATPGPDVCHLTPGLPILTCLAAPCPLPAAPRPLLLPAGAFMVDTDFSGADMRESVMSKAFALGANLSGEAWCWGGGGWRGAGGGQRGGFCWLLAAAGGGARRLPGHLLQLP